MSKRKKRIDGLESDLSDVSYAVWVGATLVAHAGRLVARLVRGGDDWMLARSAERAMSALEDAASVAEQIE